MYHYAVSVQVFIHSLLLSQFFYKNHCYTQSYDSEYEITHSLLLFSIKKTTRGFYTEVTAGLYQLFYCTSDKISTCF